MSAARRRDKKCRIFYTDAFYSDCVRRTTEISALLSELHGVQRSQEEFQFDFGSVDATTNARSQFSVIRSNLTSYASRIEENVRETERLCEEGVETLSPEQFHSLKENQQKLRTTYESILSQTDAVLDRLDLATALLIEFSTKSSQLQSWILDKTNAVAALRRSAGDVTRLADSRRALKALDEEIARRACDELKGLGQLASRINAEICGYVEELRRKDLAAAHLFPQLHHHQINETVERVQEDYAAMIRAKSELTQLLNRLKTLSGQQEDRLSAVTGWLSDVEEQLTQPSMNESPNDQRLNHLLDVQRSITENRARIDDFGDATRALIDATIGTDAHETTALENGRLVESIEKRYISLNHQINEKLTEVRAEKTQHEGLQRGVDDMTRWLDGAEKTMLRARALPLDLLRLNEIKYENQTKYSELSGKSATLTELTRLLEQMRANAPGVVETQRLDERVEQTRRRLSRLHSGVDALNENLVDLTDALGQLNAKNAAMTGEQTSLATAIIGLDPTDATVVAAVEARLTRLVGDDWNELETLARRVISIPDIESTKFVDVLMRNTEADVNRLQSALEAKLSTGEKLQRERANFRGRFDEAQAALRDVESRVDALAPLDAFNHNESNALRVECDALKSALTSTRALVDQTEALGAEFIGASGGAKRQSANFDSEALSQVARGLFDLRRRQEEAERTVAEVTRRVLDVSTLIDAWTTQRDALANWLTTKHAEIDALNEAGLQPDRERLTATQSVLTALEADRAQKQTEMNSFCLRTQQILGFPNANEKEKMSQQRLAAERDSLADDWTRLEAAVTTLRQSAELVGQMASAGLAVDHWLTSKRKTFQKLCGTLTSAKQLDNQVIVLQMLESDVSDEEPKLRELNSLAEKVISALKNAKHESTRQSLRQSADTVGQRWSEFGADIRQRRDKIAALLALSGEFDALHDAIKRDLMDAESLVGTASAGDKNAAKLERIDAAERASRAILERVCGLSKIGARVHATAPDETSLHVEMEQRAAEATHAADALLRKVSSLRDAATSSSIARNELIRSLDELIERASSLVPQLEVSALLPADSVKLADYVVRFQKLSGEIDAANDGQVTFISRKAAELLAEAPDADVTQKSRELADQWRSLQADARTRGQNINKARKVLDEFDGLMKNAKEDLAETTRLVADAKDTNSAASETSLAEAERRLERADALLDQLEGICAPSELKRHRLHVDELRRQCTHIASDCRARVDAARKKDDLRAKFDATAKALHSDLEATRREYKLGAQFSDGERFALGKAAFGEGSTKFEKISIKLRELNDETSRDLQKLADAEERAEIRRQLDALEAESADLRDAFQSATAAFRRDQSTLEEMETRGKEFADAVNTLVEKMANADAIARGTAALDAQHCQVEAWLADTDATANSLNQLADDCRTHFAAQPPTVLLQTVQLNTHKLERARADALQRKRAISATRERIERVKTGASSTLEEIERTRSGELFAPLASADVGELRARQSAMLRLKGAELRLLAEKVDDVCASCRELIRSAAPGVATGELEETMSAVSAKWQELSALVEGQERHIDATLQGVGNYGDAHAALLDWLEQTEALFAAQRPPAADHKVVRAQLQNHEFQTRLLNDKKPSVDGFVATIEKMKALTQNDAQKTQLQAKADDITSRHEALAAAAEYRRQLLSSAQELTAEFAQLSQGFGKFLDEANKTLTNFGKIPTDAEKLEQQIQLQTELQNEVEAHRKDFDQLMALYAEIVKIVDVEDASELEAAVRTLSARYGEVNSRCANCGQLLAALAEDISSFIQNANQLAEWLDTAEDEIQKFDALSTSPDELVQQSEELTKLAIAVAEQGALVSQVVEESRELCTHASGGEAIALQYRIDCLRQRYSQLAAEADGKIAALSRAIPLSEELRDGFQEVTDFLDGIEEDIENLDQVSWSEQNHVVETIESELDQFRTHLDDLRTMCVDLQRLSCESKANELAKRSQEISLRFNTVSDTVSRKADQLRNAERQSRHTFDVLDFWIDWFNETLESLRGSEPPSVDMVFLRAQLKQQRTLNEEIANERAGLRNVIVDATRIARELSASSANKEGDLIAKIEKTKKLAENTAEAGIERTAALEQALVLCQELDESYTELNDWMDEMEEILRNCDAITTGMNAKALVQQQIHNNDMLQAVQAQRPIVAKFERNIAAMSELCSRSDATNLRQIADQVLERFDELAAAFRERGEALAATAEQSSEFADRLDVFLANLQGALNQTRHSESASARVPVLRQQIADNLEILELMKQKENAFKSMKNDAQEILAQARDGQPAIQEVAQNIDILDDLWLELHSGATARHNYLTDCLRHAEAFWLEYELAQAAIASLGREAELIHVGAGDAPDGGDTWRRERLAALDASLHGAAGTQMNSLRAVAAKFCEALNDVDERTFVQQHLALIDANWNAFAQMFAQLNTQLTSHLDLANRFQELFSHIDGWLNDVERRVDVLPSAPATADDPIRDRLAAVDALRVEMDEKSLQREQLYTLGAELCAGQPPAQAAATRAFLGEIGQRWARLAGQMARQLQQLERALLEKGQFTQAHDQFAAWIQRTQATLDEMRDGGRLASLKHVEIELCKFRIVHNDICAHQPSYEAIMNAGHAFLRNHEHDSTSGFSPAALDTLAQRWSSLNADAERLRLTLEASQQTVGEHSAQLDNWTMWLADVLAELKTTRPVGGLPETAAAQLDEFRILAADVEQRRERFLEELERLGEQLAAYEEKDGQPNADGKKDDSPLAKQYAQLKRDWDTVQVKLVERESKLTDALRDAIELFDGMSGVSDWLIEAANALSLAPAVSRLPDKLRQQIVDHNSFNDEVHTQKERLKELHNKGVRIQLSCEKKDAIPMKNKLVSLKHLMDKIAQRTVERSRQLDNASADSRSFFDVHDELLRWTEHGLAQLTATEANGAPTASNLGARVRELLDEHKVFQNQIQLRESTFDATQMRGRSLEEHAPPAERAAIAKANGVLREKWEALNAKSLKRRQSLDEALAQNGKFDEIMADMLAWLDITLGAVSGDAANCSGDVDTVHALLKDYYANVAEPLKARRPNLDVIHERASQILAGGGADDAEMREVREQIDAVDAKWTRLVDAAAKREEHLTAALAKAVDLSELLHDFQDFVADIESKIRRITVPSEEAPTLDELRHVDELRAIVERKSADVDRILELARSIHANCHRRAELAMRELIRSVTGRWELLNNLLSEKTEKLNSRLETIREHEKLLKFLIDFIEEKRAELAIMSDSDDQEQLSRLAILVDELAMFKTTLRERQPDVDEARRIMKKTSAPSVQIQTPTKAADTSPKESPRKSTTVPSSAIAVAKASAIRKTAEKKQPVISDRQQRMDKMSETWTALWTETDAYEARLAARRADLEEMKRLESFTFDQWRERYLAWNDHGKARISDLFRRIDKSGTGVVPRKLFIDGILASKFPTTVLEMGKVADEFDKGDGHISAREFMNALRYDPKKRNYKPKTESERIHEEIARETTRCTCAHRFPIQHISGDDSKVQYGFGFGNNMKRMVRILRSTVMVRVGGGWEALDEFLIKHDPCRTKGRINVEMLHGQEYRFGSTDHMAAFTPRKSSVPSSSSSLASTPAAGGHRLGPIMKIREKTERSVPMFKKPATPKSPSSSIFSTPFQQPRRRDSDDLILGDNSRIPRPTSTAASSRSSSRQNLTNLFDGLPSSRPASRCSSLAGGSDVSSLSRIPSLRGPKNSNSRSSPKDDSQ